MAILTTLGFALFCLQSIDGPSAQDWSIDSFRWSKAVPEGKPIIIKNVFGNIRTRFAENKTVELSASIQKHQKDPDRAHISIELKEDALWIEVVFLPNPDQKRDTAIAGMDRRRVDLTVFIPENSFVQLETVKGLIEAKGLKSDVEARSDRGDLHISTQGHITARTQQGNIEVIFKREPSTGPYRLETVSVNPGVNRLSWTLNQLPHRLVVDPRRLFLDPERGDQTLFLD